MNVTYNYSKKQTKVYFYSCLLFLIFTLNVLHDRSNYYASVEAGKRSFI